MLRLAFLLALIFGSVAHAQLGQIAYPDATPATSYKGPGDIVSGAAAVYSLQAYTAAIAAAGTQKLINIERSSDSHTCDVLVANSGGLGVTANCSTSANNGETAAAFCNATTCTWITWYGQIGTEPSISFGSTGPTLSFTALNGLPSGVYAGAQTGTSISALALAQPYTIATVAERTGAFTSLGTIIGSTSGTVQIGFQSVANEMFIYVTDYLTPIVADSVAHSAQTIVNGGSSQFVLDGAGLRPITLGTLALAGTFSIGGDVFADNPATGAISEVIVYPSAFSSGQSAAYYANSKARWRTP